MIKRYSELNLHELRDKAGLDFAHYTLKAGQCSCCYGPLDQAKKHFSKEFLDKYNVKTLKDLNNLYDNKEALNSMTYILFKNAINNPDSGYKKLDDRSYSEVIMWDFEMEKMDLVCKLLEEYFGESYKVIKPTSKCECIKVEYVG